MDCVVWTMNSRGSIAIIRNLIDKGVNFHQIKVKKNGFNKNHLKMILKYSLDGFDSLISRRSSLWNQIQNDFEDLRTQEVIELIASKPEIMRFPILFDGHNVYHGNQIVEYINDMSDKTSEQVCSVNKKEEKTND